MGTRSRYVAATAATVSAALAVRRRRRLHRAALGIREAILPTHVDGPSDPDQSVDELHAPGHGHVLRAAVARPTPRPLRSRPWTKHAHGMQHPFAGE